MAIGSTELHSPVASIALMPMVSDTFRYGYYCAAQQLLAGDPALALQAQAYYSKTLGLDARFAKPYDGVSIHGTDKLVVRVCLQNFFTDQRDVRVHDYPHTISMICGECGNGVIEQQSDGNDFLIIRLREYIYGCCIPLDVMLPKCRGCGTVYLGTSRASIIAQQMGGELPSITTSTRLAACK